MEGGGGGGVVSCINRRGEKKKITHVYVNKDVCVAVCPSIRVQKKNITIKINKTNT